MDDRPTETPRPPVSGWLIPCSLAFLTYGCPPSVSVMMFNHTSENLVIVVWSNEYPVPAGGWTSFPLTLGAKVRSSAGELEFSFPSRLRYEGTEYVETRAFRPRLLKMELRADHKIYVLPASAAGPGLTPYPHQCQGFPVGPRHGVAHEASR
jgi:hypothetical protein